MTDIARHNYPILDGMRGVAAIGVLLFHFKPLLPIALFKAGYLAVDLFFCLSGFVIALAYERRLRDGLSLVRFAAIRLIRLWPLVALGVALGVVQALAMPAIADPALRSASAAAAVLVNLLLLPWLGGPGRNIAPVNPAHWSLFYELAINLAYAATAKWLSNRILVALVLAGFLLLAIGAARFGNLHFGAMRDQLPFGIGRVTCAFFSGVLLFRWRDRLGAAPFARHWWLAPALTALALTLPVGQTLRPWFDALFVLFGAPLLVWLGVASHAPERALPCLNGLGRLSYPLYALHFPLFLAAAGLAAHFPEVRVMIAFVAMAVACAASLLIARWYDMPLRRALTARFIMSPHFGSRAPRP